jgi:uncharacterized protein
LSALAYVDTSALVKLVLEEPDSPAMHRWHAETERMAISRLGVIETARAAQRQPHDSDHLERVLASVVPVELDAAIARAAASIPPAALRTLEAIHLATAMALLPELDAFVTYDDPLAEAARAIGLPVVRPA